MNSILKSIIYILLLFFITNIKGTSIIKYDRYIKNYYHISSSESLSQSFKTDFYDIVYKHINKHQNEPLKIYKTCISFFIHTIWISYKIVTYW